MSDASRFSTAGTWKPDHPLLIMAPFAKENGDFSKMSFENFKRSLDYFSYHEIKADMIKQPVAKSLFLDWKTFQNTASGTAYPNPLPETKFI